MDSRMSENSVENETKQNKSENFETTAEKITTRVTGVLMTRSCSAAAISRPIACTRREAFSNAGYHFVHTAADLFSHFRVHSSCNRLTRPARNYVHPYKTVTRGLKTLYMCICMCCTYGWGGGFFLVCEDFGRMFDNSFPACAFFLFF